MRAVTVTESVECGIAGEWETSRMRGAMLALATELARPGVPPVTVLEAQFSPVSLVSAGLISSRDGPPPSAACCHCQPWWPWSRGPSRRTAQSPLVAYSTLSTVLPAASTRRTDSRLLERPPVQLPTTLETSGYFVANRATSAATTRKSPAASVPEEKA